MKLYVAAQWLRLAEEAFRQRLPDWPAQMEELLVKLERSLPASVPVTDTFGVSADPQMPFLAQALEPLVMQPHLPGKLHAIRVRRYKPQRRCLIEYECDGTTVLGKVRAKGLDEESCRVQQVFASRSGKVGAPAVLGVIATLHMWLQRQVPGTPAIKLLTGPDGPLVARRIAEALYWVHTQQVPSTRTHTVSDELRILHERLGALAEARPTWAERLKDLLAACDALSPELHGAEVAGIHRDFYHDHVLIDGERLWLVDFDLYCWGDPALDIGNFWGHLVELGVRQPALAKALTAAGEALVDRYVELASGNVQQRAVHYRWLTLARHVWISSQFPERKDFTETLLALCERGLNVATAEVTG